MKKNLFPAFATLVGFTLLFATELSAQQLATLNVTVTDPSGSVILQARVTLRNLETDGKRTDFSSVTGVAVVRGLPAGKYQLTVESSQFSTYQGSLTLTVGQNASIAVTLGIKTVQEDIEVQETALALSYIHFSRNRLRKDKEPSGGDFDGVSGARSLDQNLKSRIRKWPTLN